MTHGYHSQCADFDDALIAKFAVFANDLAALNEKQFKLVSDKIKQSIDNKVHNR